MSPTPFWHPSRWTYKHYLGVGILLLGINILGPRGWIHHYYIRQEIAATEAKIQNEEELIQVKTEALQRLSKSTKLKERLAREYLGLLKEDEWSIEFQKASGPSSSP
jgi:hypothetical protein